MIEKDIEQRLQALRSRFMKNFPQDENDLTEQVNAFVKMSDQQREDKISDLMNILSEKKALLNEKYTLSADEKEKRELKENIELITERIEQMRSELSSIRLGKHDDAKIEKIKRQLISLELKRSKTILGGKDCSRIDQKIAEKKAEFLKNNSFSKEE